MKLGEALTVRARQAQKMNDLLGRIKASVVAQEGDTPPEDPMRLADAYLDLSDEHSALVLRINKTNADLVIDEEGGTLLWLLQERERLTRQRNLYAAMARSATPSNDVYRYSRSEIKMVSQVDIAALRGFEEKTNAEIARLDIQIQQINWQTDLAE